MWRLWFVETAVKELADEMSALSKVGGEEQPPKRRVGEVHLFADHLS